MYESAAADPDALYINPTTQRSHVTTMPTRDTDGMVAYYYAIGKVVVAAAGLDNRLAEQIRILVTAEPLVARILTARMGFRARMDALGALIAYRTTRHDILDAFRTFASRSVAAMERRNFFAHSLWGATVRDGKISVGTHRQSRKLGVGQLHGQFDAAGLVELASELHRCIEAAHYLSRLLHDYAHGVYFARPGSDDEMETGMLTETTR